MYSSLFTGMSLHPNPVDRYDPEEFTTLKLGEDVSPGSAPDELPQNQLAMESVKHHIRQSGSFQISPFSMNWNQHSQIYTVVTMFKQVSNSVSLSSCRVDAIANDPGLAQLIEYFGSTNMVTAVEGVSERIRNFLQKSITPNELYMGFHNILLGGFSEIKIYMIYTGLESKQDFEEWDQLLKYIQELKRKFGKPSLPVRVSFTPLFSTLGTPSMYHGSLVSKSMKMGVPPIFELKRIANKYDVGIRLSASIDSSDLGQMLEFIDRRGQPLIEYGSICGLSAFPKLQCIFHINPREVPNKTEFQKVDTRLRWEKDGKLFVADEARKFTINQMWSMMMDGNLYPEMRVADFVKYLISLDGQPIPPEVFAWMIPSLRLQFAGQSMTVLKDEAEDYFRTTAKGKKQYRTSVNMSVSNTQVAFAKELLPLVTGGQTFEDITSDKCGMTIFPSDHVKTHHNRHGGFNWKTYLTNRIFVHESYCLSSRMGACLVCGACLDRKTTKVRIILDAPDNRVIPVVENSCSRQAECANKNAAS